MEKQICLDGLTKDQIRSLLDTIDEYKQENASPDEISVDYENGYVVELDGPNRTASKNKEAIDMLNILGLYTDTKTECEKLIAKMKIAHQLKLWSMICTDKVNYNDPKQIKYYMCLNTDTKRLATDCSSMFIHNEIYFTDIKILQKVIDIIGEQTIIREYFGKDWLIND